VPSVFVTDENVAPTLWVLTMSSPLKDIIFLKTSQLQQAGIMQRWVNLKYDSKFGMKIEEIGPQVLQLQHLETGFVVILCLFGLSIGVFALEFAPKLWKKLLAWLKKGVFCFVLVKFTRMNKLM
jgi:hypothetical protein